MSLAILDFINYIFLPEYCLICNKNGGYICLNCIKHRLKVNFKTTCHVCGNTVFKGSLHKECEDSTNLDKLYFFCEYNSASKKLIENIKYSGYYAIIDNLVPHMVRYLKFINPAYQNLVVTGVPSHWHKKNVRGFNQSELIARKVASGLDLKYVNLLQKTKQTSKQAGTSKNSRNANLRKVFEYNSVIVPQNVMIIDDVHTTGATLNECAGILKKAGVKTVYGYTFAKSMNYSPVGLV